MEPATRPKLIKHKQSKVIFFEVLTLAFILGGLAVVLWFFPR